MYIYAPLRKKTLPTIGEALKAVQLAEAKSNPDPRPLISILARLPQADTKLLGLQLSVKDAVKSWPWHFVPADDTPAAKTIAEETHLRFVQSRLHHYFGVMLGAEFYGLTALRQVFDKKDGKGKMVASVSIVPATELMLKKGSKTKPDRVVLLEDKEELLPQEIESTEQYIITQFNPFEETQPLYVGGIYRTAMWMVLIKHFNFQDWAHFNEVFGEPLRVAKYKVGAGEKDKAIGLQAVRDMGKNAYAFVSEDILLEFIEAVRSGSVTAYRELCERVDNALIILLKGATMSTDVEDKGSRAVADVHKDVEDDRMWARLEMVQQSINEQWSPVDFRLNVSDSDQALRARFEFITDEGEDFESNARIITDLTAAEYELDDTEVSEKTGFTVKKRATPTPDNRDPIPG